MSDMTSAVAIDLIDNLIGMIEDNQENDYDAAFRMAIESLKAQAERTEERTETHACDCISRQAAIDIVQGYAEQLQGYIGMPNDSEVYAYARGLLLSIDRNIKALPSAQPEIVQCEDCRHWEQETFNDGYCTEMDLRMCDADFYCGYAERRTDGIR